MIHGLDTGFLVAAEVAEHAEHTTAREILARLVAAGDQVAVAPQQRAEVIHVVTDPRRFAQPPDRRGQPRSQQLRQRQIKARSPQRASACERRRPR